MLKMFLKSPLCFIFTVFTYTVFINTAVAQNNVINKADYVLKNDDIYTVNATSSWVGAIAIQDKKIIYVVIDQGVKYYIGEHTQVIDLKGKMVLPGFQDSHIHPVGSALNSYMCSLFVLPSIDAYLGKIKQCVAENPMLNGSMVHGWSHHVFKASEPDKKCSIK
jgi:predicted amidohydrolase YtcJ